MKIRTIPFITIIFVLPFTISAQLLPPDTSWVNLTLKSMSLEEKLGQMFMPVHRNVEQSLDLIQKCSVGGFWFGRTEAQKIASELNELQKHSKLPLLISADFEKGAGTYVDSATDLPANMALGASRNPQLVRKAASLIAKESRSLGVHINFAPVLDVNNNASNPIINTRSYGEDPKLVAELGKAAIQGYQENGLLATGKHFPGHGNTITDSHAMLGVVESSPTDFENIELYPYKEVLKSTNLSSIMSAHLWIKTLDTDTIPATVSYKAMTGLLRGRLGFKGIIFTDAMVMGGITKLYGPIEAIPKAIKAGCDVILFSQHNEEGIAALKEAILKGEISEQRIDESVRRILLTKTQVGIHKVRLVDIEKIPQTVGTTENYKFAKDISSQCITLVKDSLKLLPLPHKKRIAVISVTNHTGFSMTSREMMNFPSEVIKLNINTDTLTLSPKMKQEEIENAIKLAKSSDIVIIAAYMKMVISSGTIEMPQIHKEFIQKLREANPNIVLISFGNPYIISSVPFVSTYISGYDNAQALQEVMSHTIFGKLPFKGKLPVTISPEYKSGTGIVTK